MAEKNIFPTKGNLIMVKNSLELAKQGYELMDKKRNILIRELMNLNEEAKAIQSEINETFTNAYEALQQANIEVGIHYVQEISHAVPIETSVRIKTRSIMGTEIPKVEYTPDEAGPSYGFYSTRESVDRAREGFLKVKELTNITIPTYTALVKDISNALEEKEREEFTRLKVIKRNMNKKKAQEAG